MTEQTVSDLTALGYERVDPSVHWFELQADRRCVFNTWPKFVSADQPPQSSEIGECQWNVLAFGSHQAIRLSLDTRQSTFATYFFGTDTKDHLVLWTYLGDPDLWKYLEFEKW